MRQGVRRASWLLLLFGLGLVRYHAELQADWQLGDEGPYFRAFEHVLAGRSPYLEPQYYYPPGFAWAGAHAVGALGARCTTLLLRLANLAGLVVACASAVLWMPARRRARRITAAVLLCAAPPVMVTMTYGNLSGVACGAVLGALVLWRRFPAAGGALLGGSLVLKPVGALVLLLSLVRRGGRSLVAVASAVLVAAAGLAIGASELPSMLVLSSAARERSSASIVHVLDCFGLHVSAVLVGAIVAIACVAVVGARPMPWHRVALVACSGSVLAAPLVWDHTMVLALPLVVATVAPAVQALRRATRPDRPRALLVALASGLGALVLFGTREWTAFPDAPRLLQGALGCVPLATLVATTIVAVRSTGATRGAAATPRDRARAGAPR
jgi:hypothetical protein